MVQFNTVLRWGYVMNFEALTSFFWIIATVCLGMTAAVFCLIIALRLRRSLPAPLLLRAPVSEERGAYVSARPERRAISA